MNRYKKLSSKNIKTDTIQYIQKRTDAFAQGYIGKKHHLIDK